MSREPSLRTSAADTTAPHLSTFTTGDGVRLAYRIDGPIDKPVLVLSNSIATSLHMWDSIMPELCNKYRVVRYDARGHGASEVPSGPYSLGRFGYDVLEMLDELRIPTFHFLGLSLGGLVGQWLGIHAPQRIDRLILSNTAAYLGPRQQWDISIKSTLRIQDMADTAEMFMRNWFPAELLGAHDSAVDIFREMVLATDPKGLSGAYALIRDTDLRRTITLIDRPTLVIAGEKDPVIPARLGQEIASTIPGASIKILPTMHVPSIEFRNGFLQIVTAFLSAEASN